MKCQQNWIAKDIKTPYLYHQMESEIADHVFCLPARTQRAAIMTTSSMFVSKLPKSWDCETKREAKLPQLLPETEPKSSCDLKSVATFSMWNAQTAFFT